MHPEPDFCIRQNPNLKAEGLLEVQRAAYDPPHRNPTGLCEWLRDRNAALHQAVRAGLRACGRAFWCHLVRACCWGCASPLDDPEAGFCPRCRAARVWVPPSAVHHVPFVYDGPVARAIRRAKFQADATCARALSSRFALEAAASLRRMGLEVDAVTCVPSHWRRRLRRRVDLPALCADALASQLSLPLLSLLIARRCDQPLSAGADARERRARVAGRFCASPTRRGSRSPRPTRILLIDDVVTTGATLAECQRTLLEAGCLEVWCLALAATPRHAPTAPQEEPEERAHALR